MVNSRLTMLAQSEVVFFGDAPPLPNSIKPGPAPGFFCEACFDGPGLIDPAAQRIAAILSAI
jgi:hypothetical protein